MEEADTGRATDGHVRPDRAGSAGGADGRDGASGGEDTGSDAEGCDGTRSGGDAEGCDGTRSSGDAVDGGALRETIVEAIGTLPPQPKLVFLAVLSRDDRSGNPSSTGEVYNVYDRLCLDAPVDPLSQRRVTDLLEELDTFGLVSTTVVSEGRYGRTREIESAVAPAPARAVVLADDRLDVDPTGEHATE